MPCLCLYEVNCYLQPEAKAEFLIFLDTHAQELLKLKGFMRAHVYEPEEDCNCPKGAVTVTVQYEVLTRANLEHYFENEAPAMKAETISKFGSKIVGSTRRIIKVNKHLNRKIPLSVQCCMFLSGVLSS
jgi:hypothetical protein